MTSKGQNIDDYTQGDDLVIEVTIKDEDGDRVDVSGASFRYGVAEKLGEDPIFEKTTSDGISIVDGPSGEIEIEIDSSDTETLQGFYRHELELVNSSGEVSTVVIGNIEIVDQIV